MKKYIEEKEKIISQYFKSLRKSIHWVNDKYIYPVVWFEKGKKTEVTVMEEK